MGSTLTAVGVDGSEGSHGMCEMRPAGTSTRLTLAGADCSVASHGMCDARTAGTLIRLTLCSGAIHPSDTAPLLKKLSCTGTLYTLDACSMQVNLQGDGISSRLNSEMLE